MNITQDTILKLVFRQGSDNDRKRIIFTTGEPAYSTNTRRLYVGNGVLSGGDVVGNLFLGYDTTLGSFANNKSPGVIGDMGFVLDSNKLYALSANTGSLETDWKQIGGVYTSGDDYITINSSNVLSLNPLSAYSASNDFVTGEIVLDNGRIALSSTIPFQKVSNKTITVSSYLNGFVDGVDVSGIAVNPLSSNLIITLSSKIPFQTVSTKTITASSGLYATSNGVNVTGLAVNSLSSDLIIGLRPLSAYSASNDFVTGPIILDNGRVALSSTIPFQAVSTKTITASSGLYSTSNGVITTGLAFNPLSSNTVIGLRPLSAYSASNDFVTGPIILDNGRVALSSTIPFQAVSTKTITASSGLYSTSNGVDVTGIAVNPLSANLIIESNQLYVRYNGLSGNVSLYSRNMTSTRLSAGHYKFTYGPLSTSDLIPNVQIFGTDALGYDPRVTTISNSACEVQILSSNGSKTDANITLLISY